MPATQIATQLYQSQKGGLVVVGHCNQSVSSSRTGLMTMAARNVNVVVVVQRVRLFHSKLFAGLLLACHCDDAPGRPRVRTPATKLMDCTCLQTRPISALQSISLIQRLCGRWAQACKTTQPSDWLKVDDFVSYGFGHLTSIFQPSLHGCCEKVNMTLLFDNCNCWSIFQLKVSSFIAFLFDRRFVDEKCLIPSCFVWLF